MNPEETVNVREIGEVRKSPFKVLKVRVGDFRGRPYCYLQTWDREVEETGPGTPRGTVGLSITPNVLKDLLPLLEEAMRVAERRRREPGP